MKNLPKVKLGIVAVSRDCFPIELSRKRRENVVRECRKKGVPIVKIETIVENEKDAMKALAVYVELYRLYRRLHDAFGSKKRSSGLYNVMKDLLVLRDRLLRGK